MRGKFLVFGIFLLMLIGLSSAMTIVHVKTLPLHTVFLTPIQAGGGNYVSLDLPMQGFSNEYGDVVFEFELAELVFDVNVLVKDGKEAVFSKRNFGDLKSGEFITGIIALPLGVLPLETPEDRKIWKSLEEEEIKVVEEVLEEENESIESNYSELGEIGFKRVLLNGYAAVEGNKPMVYTLYYSIIGITALLLIFFTVRRNGDNLNKIKKDKGNVKVLETDELSKAEEELKKVQARVEELKGKKKESLEEAKKKLLEAEKEIMRLRGVKIEESKEVTTEEMKRRLEE